MSAPLTPSLRAQAQPVSTAGNDLETVVGQAPYAATVTSVQYIPVAAATGANTNSRTLSLYNGGQAGAGTTAIATLALVSGVNLTKNDETAITLSATAADLVLVAGDTLTWKSLHVGTGIADPGGTVVVTLSRNASTSQA